MKIKKTFLYFIFLLFSGFFSHAQQQKDAISYEPDTLSLLRNPAVGWGIYEEGWSFNPGQRKYYDPVKFWEEIDEVKAYEYATHLYIRVLWKVLEPEEGKYAWLYNEEYKAYIQKAKDRGLKLAFRVFFDDGVPDFVYKAGAKYTSYSKSSHDRQPYYDDPVFQKKLANFIEAFAEEYDDPDMVDFVDAYGLGQWGEGHGVTLKDERNYQQTIRFVTKMYADKFKHILTVINLADFDYKYTKPYAYDELGFLPRRDGIGSHWFNDVQRDMLSNDLFPAKALIGEGCYWMNSPAKDTIRYDAFKSDPRFKMNNYYEAFTVAVEDALFSHANTFDLRVPYECKYWINKLPHEVQRFITNGGYRFYPALIQTELSGLQLKISHVWVNHGVGVLPNRHPNWNHKYKVGFCVKKKNSDNIVMQYIDPSIEPADWLKENTYGYHSKFLINADIPPGDYQLYVGIIDVSTNKPGIDLAVDSQLKRNKWVYVTSFHINR